MSGDGPDVVVIGAGMAGLACARRLHELGRSCVVCEASGRVGGRVATDMIDGYRLDRGFQVLLTSYPEARRWLDYEALDLRRIYPGALVRSRGRWHRVADPFRHPVDGLRGILNPVGTLADKLRVGWMRMRGFDFTRGGGERDALEALREAGFSSVLIERFFRPFLGGVFLENRLETSARKLEFVMRHFAAGDTAVPARGMGEIPRQMAAALPDGVIRLGARVEEIGEDGVRLAGGEVLRARAVVVATDAATAGRLTGLIDEAEPVRWNGVACLHYAARSAPVDEPVLMLNGEGEGVINNLTVMSAVSGDYAPEGRHLVSVSVVDDEAARAADVEDRVGRQLRDWFDAEAAEWELLRTDRIAEGVPVQREVVEKPVRVRAGVYQCGDHCGVASLNTAMASGAAAADAVAADPGFTSGFR